MSGAARQVETRREEVEAIVGPAVAFYSAVDDAAIASAERAVIEAAMEWHVSDPYLTNSKKLRSRLAKLSELRAILDEPKP